MTLVLSSRFTPPTFRAAPSDPFSPLPLLSPLHRLLFLCSLFTPLSRGLLTLTQHSTFYLFRLIRSQPLIYPSTRRQPFGPTIDFLPPYPQLQQVSFLRSHPVVLLQLALRNLAPPTRIFTFTFAASYHILSLTSKSSPHLVVLLIPATSARLYNVSDSSTTL
jgi:hypothetical protein